MIDSKMRRLCGILSLLLAISAPALPAGPTLTTVQDILYKADGSPFTGLLYINWKSFISADAQNITTQNVVASVVNGVLRVQLAPTTNAQSTAWYQVGYNSGGSIQFTEYWAVPPSTSPVGLKDVRMPAPPSSTAGVTTPPPVTTPIQIGDVTGLTDELASRVVRGAGYQPARAAVMNASGMLDAAVGNSYDCVRVDGTSGPCGGGSTIAGPSYIDGEVPAGNINGSNTVFTLTGVPSPAGSLLMFRNGILQKPSVDFTLSDNQVTFLAGAIPAAGDVLFASYRIPGAGSISTGLGGVLMGDLPNPSLAPGVVTDYNIAPGAGIAESKLALNFPTHANSNDPTPEQKLALGGTAGVVSGANRFVTDQDPRLTDARTAKSHTLLGASHSDTIAGNPLRGDMIVGQGAGTWTRLALGPPNRCLMSNGADAVWNTCLFTGFSAGSMPFVDATGALTQNNSRLFWDNSNRRFGIGNNSPLSTLHVQDATPLIGSTTVTVRAGQGQADSPLQRWVDMNGVELGRVDGQGILSSAGFEAASTPSRAAWRDAGTAADPGSPTDGDAWFNTSGNSRKTREIGQTHAVPQVICSTIGGLNNNSNPISVGTCTIPAGLLRPGDRIEVKYDYSHDGSATGFTVEIAVNQTVILSRTMPASEGLLSGAIGASVFPTGLQWSSQTWGAVTSQLSQAGSLAVDPNLGVRLDFRASLAVSGAENVGLNGYTVVRYPSQVNP